MSLRRDSRPDGAPLTPPVHPSTHSRGPTFSLARTFRKEYKSSGRRFITTKPRSEEFYYILLY